MLRRLGADRPWDVVVIGGGATGLGVAVDAQTRGYRTLLLEQHDFAKATSSRSTKLVHGGVRYLKQGNVSLVLEALRERGLLCRNAPHLVHDLAFVVPALQVVGGAVLRHRPQALRRARRQAEHRPSRRSSTARRRSRASPTSSPRT